MILRFVVLMLFKARALSWFPFGIVNLQNHPVFSFGIFIQISALGVKRESVRGSFSLDQARLSKDTIQKRNFSDTRTLGLTGVTGSSR